MTEIYMLSEISLMRELKHPNLAELYEVFELDSHVAIVMEYLNKGNLAQRLTKTPFSEKQAFQILRMILEGLKYMHSKNIMHRDIKPGNIMLRDPLPSEGNEEICKIIDFGLSANLLDKSDEALIHDKSGTVGYLAPEIITKEGKTTFYNEKVDVFSAGIIFYEM